MTFKIDHDKVISKLLAGEKLTDIEKAYIEKTVKSAKLTEFKGRLATANTKLRVVYTIGKYKPSKEELERELVSLYKVKDVKELPFQINEEGEVIGA